MNSCVHKWTAYHMLYLCLSLQVSSVGVQHDNSWHSETDSYIAKLLHMVTIYCYHISFLYSEPPAKSLDPDQFCKSVDSVCPSHQSWLCCNTPTNENYTAPTSHSSSTPPYRPLKHHPSLWVMSEHMEVESQLIRPATHVGHVGDCCTPQIFQQLNGLRQTTHQMTGVLAFWHAWS